MQVNPVLLEMGEAVDLAEVARVTVIRQVAKVIQRQGVEDVDISEEAAEEPVKEPTRRT